MKNNIFSIFTNVESDNKISISNYENENKNIIIENIYLNVCDLFIINNIQNNTDKLNYLNDLIYNKRHLNGENKFQIKVDIEKTNINNGSLQFNFIYY